MSIFQPSNQIKLTNVSVVRLKKGGKRFEIACYKNKVMEWRNGIERDLDNVLQTPTIFSNVSKGKVAPSDDLKKAFKSEDSNSIILEILKRGEMQVSTMERQGQLESLQKDVVNLLVEKTINPDTKRPYPASVMERCVADLHYNFSSGKNSKQHALEIIKLIQREKILPIARVQMRVCLNIPSKEGKRLKEKIRGNVVSIDSEEYDAADAQYFCTIEPGQFKILGDILQAEVKGNGRVDLISLQNMDGKLA